MRENRTYGSEGGEPVMDNSPTPINIDCVMAGLTRHYKSLTGLILSIGVFFTNGLHFFPDGEEDFN